MEKVIIFQPHTAMVSDTSYNQRTVYFVLGFGLIVTAMVDPPITTTWMAIANTLGALLVMLAIIGKRLIPQMDGTRLLHEPRVISNTLGLVIGLGVSILAIAQPPVASIWAAYAHIVAITLVTHAILGYDFLMKTNSNVAKSRTSIKFTSRQSKQSVHHLPKAA